MMSISMHDRISGVPGRIKLMEEGFIKYAQRQKGVVFMRKDEIARWALSAPNVPHESGETSISNVERASRERLESSLL